MNKKIVSIVIAITTLFCFIGLSACSSSNEGRIRGVSGAEFNARFYRPDLDFYARDIEMKLISSVQDFEVWQKEVIEEHRNQLNLIVGLPSDSAKRRKQEFSNFINMVAKTFDEIFFENNQVIIIPELLSKNAERFEVRRISYNDQTLTIDLRIRRPRGQMELGIAYSFGVIEITRILSVINLDLNID